MPKSRLHASKKGVSLQFKQLHDSEDELEAKLVEEGLQNDELGCAATKICHHAATKTEILADSPLDSSNNPIKDSPQEKGSDVSTSTARSTPRQTLVQSCQAGEEKFSQSIATSTEDSSGLFGKTFSHELTESIKKDTRSQDTILSVPSSRSSKAVRPLISLRQGVEDHPLMHQSSSSDSEEIPEELPTSSPSSRSQESMNDRPITRGLLSNAIFDTKARTQLLTTLKKNIQHYTSSSQIGKADQELNFHSTSDSSEAKARSSSVSSDSLASSQLSQNGIVKVWREKVLEPLQAGRSGLGDSINESESGDLDEAKSRKRSSSENNSTGSSYFVHMRKHPGPDEADAEVSKSGPAVPKSSSMALSFHLLVEKQENQDEVAFEEVTNNDQLKKGYANSTSHQKSTPMKDEKVQSSNDLVDMRSTRVSESQINSSPPIHVVFVLTLMMYLYYTLPLPPLLQVALLSFFFGVGISVCVLCMVVTPQKAIIISNPPYTTQKVPSRIPRSVLDLDQPFRGWMNEVELYDIETYHISGTNSVFVTLEKNVLRLQTPRRNIPRRAAHGERNIQVSNVIHQRLFDISKAKVYLVPSDLVKKRVWSKKYPICLEFSKSCEKTNGSDKPADIKSESSNVPESYDVITANDLKEKVFLFGRTQPQKERWFYRFQRAITLARKNVKDDPTTPLKDASEIDSDAECSETLDDKNSGSFDPIRIYEKYYEYMCSLLPDFSLYSAVETDKSVRSTPRTAIGAGLDHSKAIQFSALASHSDAVADVVLAQPKPIMGCLDRDESGLDVAWFNVVIGRIMFDFLRLQKWADWVSNKIQKKLEKIRLPYFMDGLKLTEMDLGKTVPLVHKISLPRLDSEGIWLDMDITYNGAVQMTLETKMVLTRLGKQQGDQIKMDRKSAAMNSDEEDSAESSEDEENLIASSLPAYVQHFVPKGSENVPHTTKTKAGLGKSASSPKQMSAGTPVQEKRWVRIVDSITKSKYFKKVTETNYIKKKLETVSNTPLILTAELKQCQGTICINIPPPPSDRLWYGFKAPPTMVLKAHPKLGERAVKATPVTDWIEKKLIQEFNKVFLIPNMDDIPIPLMFNNLPSST